MTDLPAVGFAGLGRMGRPMAAQLVAAGFPLTVFNRTAAVAEAFAVESGADGAAASPRELAERSAVVVTMLADGPALLGFLGGDDGLLVGLAPGTVVIDMGTSGIEHTRTARSLLAEVGGHLVEAPVSGSVPAAESRQLLVMAAGERGPLQTAIPVLRGISDRVSEVGGPGAGAAMKLAVNAVVFSLNQSLAESLVLAERAGVERSVAYEVFATSAVAAPLVHYRRPVFEHPGVGPGDVHDRPRDQGPRPRAGARVRGGGRAPAERHQPGDDGGGRRGRARRRRHGQHRRPPARGAVAIAEVTLKDVAEHLGVNASTVSRALDPAKAHLVNEATAVRVREAVQQLGYRGDHVAGSLRRRATATVGVIVADLANPFIAPVIHGIANALAVGQVLPLIFETQDDGARLASGVDHLLSRRVDAIIVAGARFGDRPVLEAATRSAPVVVAVRGLPGSPLPHVLQDDRAGGALAARHLIALGRTRLAEVRGPTDVGNFVARHEGFRDACRDAGVELVEGLGSGAVPAREEGERLAAELLSRLDGGSRPTAIFAHNDLMALGTLGVLREHGIVCPRDVSLVGYNDSPTIDQVDPPLTSIAYQGAEVGQAAGRLALDLIARPDRPDPRRGVPADDHRPPLDGPAPARLTPLEIVWAPGGGRTVAGGARPGRPPCPAVEDHGCRRRHWLHYGPCSPTTTHSSTCSSRCSGSSSGSSGSCCCSASSWTSSVITRWVASPRSSG